MPTFPAAFLRRLHAAYVNYPWRTWTHLHGSPPVLFARGGQAVFLLDLNGLGPLSDAMLDQIEAKKEEKVGMVEDTNHNNDDVARQEELLRLIAEQESLLGAGDNIQAEDDLLNAFFSGNPNWVPQGHGISKRRIEQGQPPVSPRRTAADVRLPAFFPKTKTANKADWEHIYARHQQLAELAQQRALSPSEEQEQDTHKTRLQDYQFYASVQAAQQLRTGVSSALLVALQHPEQHKDLREGRLPFVQLGQAAHLIEESSNARLLEAKLTHLAHAQVAPAGTVSSSKKKVQATTPIIPPPTRKQFLAAAAADTASRDALIKDMTDRAYKRQTGIAESVLSHDEVAEIMQKQYGSISHEQRDFIESPSSQRLLMAPPGSGKTEKTIIGAIEEMAQRRGVNPEDIHFVSPTHSGLHVMREKYPEIFGALHENMDVNHLQHHQARTMASLALSQITKRQKDEETGRYDSNAVEQLLGTKNVKLLGAGNASFKDAKTVEETVARFNEAQEKYVDNLIKEQKLKGKVFARSAVSSINALKSNQGSADYQNKILAEGEQLWKQGGASREHPHAFLYAYEQALQGRKGFSPLGQTARLYDLSDAMNLFKKAGQQGIIAKLKALIIDEVQELTPDMIRAVQANTNADSHILAAGDMGQRVFGGTRVDKQFLKALPGMTTHALTGTYRGTHQIASHVNAINMDPELQASGTSGQQVAVGDDAGSPVRYILNKSFKGTHMAVLADWFKELGHTGESVKQNMAAGQLPFTGGSIPAREAPFIVDMNEERKMILAHLEQYLRSLGLSAEEASQAIQQGVSQAVPGSEGSHADQMHIGTTTQMRSQGFLSPRVSETRGGKWSDVDWKRLRLTKASRARKNLTVFGTSQNFEHSPGFNNSFEQVPGTKQMVPHGYTQIEERAAHSMVTTHGLNIGKLPMHLQFAAMGNIEDIMGSPDEYITKEQGNALQKLFDIAADQQKVTPVINRHPIPVEGSGILSADAEEFKNQGDGEGARSTLDGIQSFGTSMIAASKGQMGLSGDSTLYEFAGRYADQLFEMTPEQRNGTTTSPSGMSQQFANMPTENFAKFMDTAKPLIGRTSAAAHFGGPNDLSSPVNNMDLLTEDMAQANDAAEIESGRRNTNDEGVSELRSNLPKGQWGDTQHLQELLHGFLADPQYMSETGLDEVLRQKALEGETLISSHGYDLASYHLTEIARVARAISSGSQPISHDPGSDRELRQKYHNLATTAEAYIGKAPAYEEGVALSPEEFARIQKSDPRQAKQLETMFANPGREKLALAIEHAPTPEAREEARQEQKKTPNHLHLNHPHVRKQIDKHIAQGRYSSLRSLRTKEQGHEFGAGRGYSQATPFMSEMALMADRLENQGILDPQTVTTIPGDSASGRPEEVFQMRGTVGLGGYEKRLREQTGGGTGKRTDEWVGPRYGPINPNDPLTRQRFVKELGGMSTSMSDVDRRLEQHDQLSEVLSLRRSVHDPEKQQAWGHTLNQVFAMSTGEQAFVPGSTEQSTPAFHDFFQPLREKSQSGQMALEDVTHLRNVLDEATAHVQSKGRWKRSHVNKILSALGHAPNDAKFKGLTTLAQHGFRDETDELPLYSIMPQPNIVGLLASSTENKARLIEQFTRAPHLMGQEYEMRGGQEGYDDLTTTQKAWLAAHGHTPGETIRGTLRPWSKKDPIGASMFKMGYIAEHLFSREEAQESYDISDQSALAPLMRLQFGSDPDDLFPVRAGQLTSLLGGPATPTATDIALGKQHPIRRHGPRRPAVAPIRPEEQEHEEPEPAGVREKRREAFFSPAHLKNVPPGAHVQLEQFNQFSAEEQKEYQQRHWSVQQNADTTPAYGPWNGAPTLQTTHAEAMKKAKEQAEEDVVTAKKMVSAADTGVSYAAGKKVSTAKKAAAKKAKAEAEKALESAQRRLKEKTAASKLADEMIADAKKKETEKERQARLKILRSSKEQVQWDKQGGYGPPTPQYGPQVPQQLTEEQRHLYGTRVQPFDSTHSWEIQKLQERAKRTGQHHVHPEPSLWGDEPYARATSIPTGQFTNPFGVPSASASSLPTDNTVGGQGEVGAVSLFGEQPSLWGHPVSPSVYLSPAQMQDIAARGQQRHTDYPTEEMYPRGEEQSYRVNVPPEEHHTEDGHLSDVQGEQILRHLRGETAKHPQGDSREEQAQALIPFLSSTTQSNPEVYTQPPELTPDQLLLTERASSKQEEARSQRQRPPEPTSNVSLVPPVLPLPAQAKMLALAARDQEHARSQQQQQRPPEPTQAQLLLPERASSQQASAVPALVSATASGRGNNEPEDHLMSGPPDIDDQVSDVAHMIRHGRPNSNVYHKPSPEQSGVYDSKAQNILIKGGPGGGKTETAVHKMVLSAIEPGNSPRNWLSLSALHSGVNELNKHIAMVKGDLPQQHPDYQFPKATTFAALAHRIMTNKAYPDDDTHEMHYPQLEELSTLHEQGPSVDRLFNPGVTWSGTTVHALTAQERRAMPPEEAAAYVEPAEYLSKAITPYIQSQGLPTPHKKEIEQYLRDIEVAKNNRTGEPNDPYAVSYLKGQQDIAGGRMSGDAALVLNQQRMQRRGDLNFSDYPHIAGQMINQFGIRAIPEHLQGLQGALVDEAQDITKPDAGMLGGLMQTLSGNKPRFIASYDPMQISKGQWAGGADPKQIETIYEDAVGKADRHVLTVNHRSPKGVVHLNNGFLESSILANEAKSPVQSAFHQHLGEPPKIEQFAHQPAMHEAMRKNMFADIGLTHKRLRENIDMGKHPLAGIDYDNTHKNGPVRPSEVFGIFTQHRDREQFEFDQKHNLIHQHGYTPQEADEIFSQLYRSDKDEPDPNKMLLTLQAGARSQSATRIHEDATMAGAGGAVEYLQRQYIAQSRANKEGRNSMYWSQHHFSPENQKLYQSNPSLLQKASNGLWNLGHILQKDGTKRPRILYADKRNKPEYLDGVELPAHFKEPMVAHVKSLLMDGTSPYHPYFQKMGLQDYAVRQSGVLGITPPSAMRKNLPASLGPRFWHRKDLAEHRAKMSPSDQEQIAGHLASYPEELVAGFAKERKQSGISPDLFLAQKKKDLYQYMNAVQQNPTDPLHAASMVDVHGKLQYIQHLQKDQHLPVLLQAADAFDKKQQQQRATSASTPAAASTPPQGHTTSGQKTIDLTAKTINVNAGQGANVNMNMGAGAGAGPTGTGTGAGSTGTPFSGQTTRLFNTPSGNAGYTGSSGPSMATGNLRYGGPMGPVVDSEPPKEKAPGFYNDAVQAGRTVARIGDEMAFIGQHMQTVADSAINEGSDYRHATLMIPRGQGATTDTYGHAYTNLNQGNAQNEQGTANIVSQIWNGITNPNALGGKEGTAMFGTATKEEQAKYGNMQGSLGELGKLFTDPGGFGQDYNNAMAARKVATNTPQKQATDGSSTSAGGDNGTQGFFDFTQTDKPNTIGYLQKNVLPMDSIAQIAQGIQGYLASTNQSFSQSGVGATTDILGLSNMTGMDAGSLTSQLASISGLNYGGTNLRTQNQQTTHIAGMMNDQFQGNLSEQNVAPYLSAMENVTPNLRSMDISTQDLRSTYPSNFVGPIDQSNAHIDQSTQAGAIFKLAINAGMNPANLSGVADMTNSLATMGATPNLQQQYALSKLYGANNITAAPDLAQYNQQQLGYSQSISSMNLQQQMNVTGLQIKADNAQITSDKFTIQQGSFNLAQNQASFNFGQYMQTQQYGAIGQDSSRTAYFDFERRQQAAGYDPSNADSASTFKPKTPFGLKNEEFYAGIEQQRSMLVLGRSPLLADAQFQQQMKYLNKQENFYVRELDLQNQQRSFDKTWGQRSLDMQAIALDIQKKQLPIQLAQLAYDKANTALQATFVPQQIAALQAIQLNTQQMMNGQGPVNGKNIQPFSLIEKILAGYKADTSSGRDQNLQNSIQSMGLGLSQSGTLSRIISSNQNLNAAQLINLLNSQGDQGLLNNLSTLNSQGGTAGSVQAAGQSNANLQQGGVGQNWDQLIQAMNDDKDAANNVAATMSSTSAFTKHMGDVATGLSPLTTALGSLSNVFGAILGFAGGGGGGALIGGGGGGGGESIGGGGGGGGEGGMAGAFMPPMPMPHPSVLGNTPMGDGQNTQNQLPPNELNGQSHVRSFLAAVLSGIDRKRYGSTGTSINGVESNYGIITPAIIKGFHAAMSYGIHQGIDFAANQGTPLSEFIGGKVSAAGYHDWGGEVDVTIPNGMTERYLHLSQIDVSPGTELKQGDSIGRTGGGTKASGLGKWSSGSHLHAQIDHGNINAGSDPWPIWHQFKEKNFVQFLTPHTEGFGGILGTPSHVPGSLSGWIDDAIALTQVPQAWFDDLQIIAMRESAGDPSNINLTDSNARAGHPSQGLFQMIPGTFAEHALPGHEDILNPIDNAISAIRYIEGRYGTVYNVPGIVSMMNGGPYVGYANGTHDAPGGWSMIGEKGPEAMWVPPHSQIVPNNQLDTVAPLSNIGNVLKLIAQQSGTSSLSSPGGGASSGSGGKASLSIQTLVGTMNVTVHPQQGGFMNDSDKDNLMADLIGVLESATRQANGKLL